ncbi:MULTISPECIES: zinc-binding dehydrogenase [Paenarthrobacter]|uniref:zinc-binding dehydrogenase n=1 Tax=Paenarthrobacter TaxID=1742992 RepID=UPI00074D3469|nr:zinc-binding dehydrogenase [Paenarthrobacter ureafaciens]AMB42115.1 alcohol dehydrogenase [Arthrobacter sp. ATCC 21022]KUR65895.1 alcohol dehydrogenase [Arthrobacter sp. ATCC 21022]RWW94804.1 alcohol dehydrogenase [Paenarthrobacter ureafaciens]
MRAVILPGDKKVVVADRERPEPKPHEVLVQTKASAICRSDMSLYYGNPIVGGEAAETGDVVPGHEAAGVVVAVGEAVTGVAVGDRVAAHLAVGCGHCEYCGAGYTMLCPDWKCFGFDFPGGDAEYFTIAARNALPLPEQFSFKAGAVLTDMIGSQYHVQKKMAVSGNKTVAVIGLGPMGSAAVLVAKGFGARVIAVDILDERLEQARVLGADDVVNSRDTDAAEAIRNLTHGRGVEVAIDCSGNPAGQNTALDAAAKLGSVAFVGESRATEINPSDQILRKLLTVVGGWYFPLGEWSEILRFIADNKVNVEAIISHEYSLEDAEQAFGAFDRRETEKAVFTWS